MHLSVIWKYRQGQPAIWRRWGQLFLTSIFFGGGTSLMPPFIIADLLDRAADLCITARFEITQKRTRPRPDGQITGFYQALALIGYPWLQSLEDDRLKILGREHSAKEALVALEKTAAIFPRWSADLIYGLPQQSQNGKNAGRNNPKSTGPFILLSINRAGHCILRRC